MHGRSTVASHWRIEESAKTQCRCAIVIIGAEGDAAQPHCQRLWLPLSNFASTPDKRYFYITRTLHFCGPFVLPPTENGAETLRPSYMFSWLSFKWVCKAF